MKVMIKPKKGVEDRQVWEFLLRNNYSVTPVRSGEMLTDVSEKFVQVLRQFGKVVIIS